MFMDKATSLPKSVSLEICFTRVGFGLTRKYYSKVEKLARDALAYCRNAKIPSVKSFITLVPGERESKFGKREDTAVAMFPELTKGGSKNGKGEA
jgi:hypothetical protein